MSVPLSIILVAGGRFLLGFYTKVPQEIAIGLIRFSFIGHVYSLCGIMDVLTGVLKGLGKTLSTALVSLGGICVLRVVWVYTVFEKYKTLESLYLSYGISWVACTLVFACMLIYYFKKTKHLEKV
jgi:Na+-driven multidrug efflux pump